MNQVSREEFHEVYQAVVDQIYGFWTPEMQSRLSQHCRCWADDCFDFRNYLDRSEKRFFLAYELFASRPDCRSVCDVGGHWGVFPVTLKRLGHDVTMTEALEYYDGCFDPLFAAIRDEGVRILDCDPFQPAMGVNEQFDFVTVMAVLEHYPHSLKPFMDNMLGLMAPSAGLYLEVPNIAYWPKRINMLLGRTPLVPVRDIYHSATPFIGHHHEFTMDELVSLAELNDLHVASQHYFDYSKIEQPFLQNLRESPWETVCYTLATRNMREMIAVVCERHQAVVARAA